MTKKVQYRILSIFYLGEITLHLFFLRIHRVYPCPVHLDSLPLLRAVRHMKKHNMVVSHLLYWYIVIIYNLFPDTFFVIIQITFSTLLFTIFYLLFSFPIQVQLFDSIYFSIECTCMLIYSYSYFTVDDDPDISFDFFTWSCLPTFSFTSRIQLLG